MISQNLPKFQIKFRPAKSVGIDPNASKWIPKNPNKSKWIQIDQNKSHLAQGGMRQRRQCETHQVHDGGHDQKKRPQRVYFLKARAASTDGARHENQREQHGHTAIYDCDAALQHVFTFFNTDKLSMVSVNAAVCQQRVPRRACAARRLERICRREGRSERALELHSEREEQK